MRGAVPPDPSGYADGLGRYGHVGNGRRRKVTNIESKYATFKLLVGDSVRMDVFFSDEEDFSIAFGGNITNTVSLWDEFVEIVRAGREFAECRAWPIVVGLRR